VCAFSTLILLVGSFDL